MDPQDRLFAETAVQFKLLTQEQVAICIQAQAAEPTRQSLAEMAVERGMIGEPDMQAVLAHLQRTAAQPAPAPRAAAPAPQPAPQPRTSAGAGGGWGNAAAPPAAAPAQTAGGGGGWGNAAPPSRPATGASGWANPAAPAAQPPGPESAAQTAHAAAPAAPLPATHASDAPDADWYDADPEPEPVARPAPAPAPAPPPPAPTAAPAPAPAAPPPKQAKPGAPSPEPPQPETPGGATSDGAPASGDGAGSVVQTLKAPLERPRIETPPGQDGYIVKLLKMAVAHRASDLHLHSGSQVLARIDGRLRPMSSGQPMPAKAAYKVIAEFLSDAQWRALAIHGETDFGYEIPDLARFRVNVYRQQRGLDIVFRVIPSQIPTLEQLGLPDHLNRLTDYRTGLVLCTGPAGCGKTTTLASLIQDVVQRKDDHVITVEDPIEFVYPPGRCVVNQREIRNHTESYSRALRAALREDPDIIVIAELRDLETISLAMSAAETGHLVLGTLHTANAAQTITRLVSVFPAEEQGQVRTMLADSLRAVISQRLVPRASGEGRSVALELLMVNTAVANMVRDNKIALLPSAMQTGKAAGMVTLDDSLHALVQSGEIEEDEARRAAVKKTRFGGK